MEKVVYYEEIKRELKRSPIHECRSDERLKTKHTFFVYYNGESESYREEMRWCRCYEGQRVEA